MSKAQMHKTVKAHSLVDGNVLQIGPSTNYLLVAAAPVLPDGRVGVYVYTDGLPYGEAVAVSETPRAYFQPDDDVQISMGGPVT